MSAGSSRAADGLFGTQTAPGPADASVYHGQWRNTRPDTPGIRELAIEPSASGLTVRVLGADGDGVIHWGVQPAETFSCVEENGVRTAALLAAYDFGFMATTLQFRINKGILALMSFNVFTDDSGRSNYYAREFFFCAGDTEAGR